MMADNSSKTMGFRKQKNDIFKVKNGRKHKTQRKYSSKVNKNTIFAFK
jgi:hypothetical protein